MADTCRLTVSIATSNQNIIIGGFNLVGATAVLKWSPIGWKCDIFT